MVNSFLLHVFDLDAATYVAVIYGKSFCFGCFRWARPLSSCCFVALETKRKSGWGICGSSWCGLFAVLFVLWFAIWWYQPIVPFTAFSLLMSLLGPCHRAFTAKLEEKKNITSAERRPGPERSPRKQYSKWSGDCNTFHEPVHPTTSSYSIWADHNANKPPPRTQPWHEDFFLLQRLNSSR